MLFSFNKMIISFISFYLPFIILLFSFYLNIIFFLDNIYTYIMLKDFNKSLLLIKL